jgi:hypothetical protein
MSAIDAELLLITFQWKCRMAKRSHDDGEHITSDRRAIITPDGHMIPNKG